MNTTQKILQLLSSMSDLDLNVILKMIQNYTGESKIEQPAIEKVVTPEKEFDYEAINQAALVIPEKKDTSEEAMKKEINKLILAIAGDNPTDAELALVCDWKYHYDSSQISKCLNQSYMNQARTLKHTDILLRTTYPPVASK